METIPCIFGHGFSEDVVIEENGFQGRRCPVCRTIYVSPRPELSEVFDLYHHDKAHLPATHHLHFNPSAELAAKAHLEAIFNHRPAYHTKNEGKLSILEIGCGGGHFLHLAKQNGFDPYGIELNPQQAVHVRESLQIPCEGTPFRTESFGERKFDIIFHCDVTSHLHDPISDFTAMAQKLSREGQLIFETGNGADVDPKYYKYYSAWQYPDHLFFFGEQSIRELLRRAGFTRIHIISWSLLPQLALIRMLKRNRGRRRTDLGAAGSSQSSVPARLNWKQRFLKMALARTMYFARFGLGAIGSNPAVPRTMLIWAMK